MSIKLKAFELNIAGFTFAPKLVPTLLSIILIPLLISLGLWQLDRADEKRIIDQGVNDAIAKPAFDLNNADFSTLEDNIYRSTVIRGEFDNKQQFLLDNRTHKGIPGYHVLSPFLLANEVTDSTSQYAVLINRGWIAYLGTRDQIEDISLENKITKIIGTVKNIPRSIVLKEQVNEDSFNTLTFKAENKKLVGVSLIQSIQLNRFEEKLNYKLLPIMIELDKTDKNGFTREWQPYYGSIDKHNAYALQWFAMATILLFLFIKLNIRKR